VRRPAAAAVWSTLAIAWAVLIVALLETPSPPSLPGGPWMPGAVQPFVDKIGHAGLFFVQAALVERALTRRLGRRGAWLAALAVVVVFGAATEIAQRWVPPRDASFGDLAADVGGALLYGVLLLADRWRSATGAASDSGS